MRTATSASRATRHGTAAGWLGDRGGHPHGMSCACTFVRVHVCARARSCACTSVRVHVHARARRQCDRVCTHPQVAHSPQQMLPGCECVCVRLCAVWGRPHPFGEKGCLIPTADPALKNRTAAVRKAGHGASGSLCEAGGSDRRSSCLSCPHDTSQRSMQGAAHRQLQAAHNALPDGPPWFGWSQHGGTPPLSSHQPLPVDHSHWQGGFFAWRLPGRQLTPLLV